MPSFLFINLLAKKRKAEMRRYSLIPGFMFPIYHRLIHKIMLPIYQGLSCGFIFPIYESFIPMHKFPSVWALAPIFYHPISLKRKA